MRYKHRHSKASEGILLSYEEMCLLADVNRVQAHYYASHLDPERYDQDNLDDLLGPALKYVRKYTLPYMYQEYASEEPQPDVPAVTGDKNIDMLLYEAEVNEDLIYEIHRKAQEDMAKAEEAERRRSLEAYIRR